MANEIYIGSLSSPVFHFRNSEIISANAYIVNAPISEELQEDNFDFVVISTTSEGGAVLTNNDEYYQTSGSANYTIQSRNLLNLKYGTPVWAYHDNALIGKFFISKIKRIESRHYKVSCISAIGLLSHIQHKGGLYGVDSTMTVANLVRDIIGTIPINIAPEFESMIIQGYLGYDTARNNLQQVLFATGAAVLKDTDGNLIVKYNEPDTAHDITQDYTYNDQQEEDFGKVTKVTLAEHRYFVGANTESEDVFNNLDDITTVENQLIIFDGPHYDLKAYNAQGTEVTSSFIVSSGVNYAVVGTANIGKARVTGKPYVHQQRQLVKVIDAQAIETNEKSVTNATLVSPLNSVNCLERLASFYGDANEVSVGFVYTDEKTGQLIQFYDKYDETRQNKILGFIKSIDITLSSTLKGETKVATNWRPNHLGNTYNRYKIIDKEELGGVLSGNWQVPSDLANKQVYIVMFNGGNGGQGGYNGSAGTGSSGVSLYDIVNSDRKQKYFLYNCVKAGNGGLGGEGGYGGRGSSRFGSALITLGATGTSYAVQLGAGGQGGNVNGGLGSAGGVTTFGQYTSDENDLAGIYVNFVDNSIYCGSGNDGVKGGDGGNGANASLCNVIPPIYGLATNGTSAGEHTGGIASTGNGYAETIWGNNYYVNGGGGGGGGASGDANGSDGATVGTSIHSSSVFVQLGDDYWVYNAHSKTGGDGGNGANAVQPSQQTRYGWGGDGSHGGGGGGGGGASSTSTGHAFGLTFARYSNGGSAGQSARGGQGSDGFILMYYTEEE